jgi:hypothetical protein
VFSVANNIALLRSRRAIVLLALVVLSTVSGRFGHPGLGMWDGPL